MRIVSLLSSATEIVDLLGLGDHLVGISHECDHPPHLLDRPRASRIRFDPEGLTSGEIDAAVREAMVRYGSVYEVDGEMLAHLQPDLILSQAVCEVCAVPTGSVHDAIASLSHAPQVLSLDAHTIDQIVESVVQVAAAADLPSLGHSHANRLRQRLDRVQAAVAGRERPRVLLLEWLDPPFLPGHWVPEMVELAGGDCLIGRTGERSESTQWEELRGLDPDILLIEPCGYDVKRAAREALAHRERLLEIAPRALADGAVWALDSAWFSRSGPRVFEGIETLSRVLHPGALDGTPDTAVARRLFLNQ